VIKVIPDFADESINAAIAGADHDDVEAYEFDICHGFNGYLYLDYAQPILKIRRIEFVRDRYRSIPIATIEYDCVTMCWLVDGTKHTGISGAALMDYLMSLSDELGEWLLWNRIL
jgi:hypothetical protein